MNIELFRYPDCEGNDNRGFMVDSLRLMVDDKPAGYLKISYIPFHRVLNWNGEQAVKIALEYYAATQKTTVEHILESGERLGMPPLLDAKTLEEVWDDLEGQGMLEGGGSISYHVDHPYVDYIRVYAPMDYIKVFPELRFRSSTERPEERAIDNYKGRGLSTLLYVEGARWMAEKGMLLHASSLQSPEAQKAWSGLQKRFPEAVYPVRIPTRSGEDESWRIVLDGSKLPAWLPSSTTSVALTEMSPGRSQESNNIQDLSEDCQQWWKEKHQKSIAKGRHPLGGELMPNSPKEALIMADVDFDSLLYDDKKLSMR
jgi:hypothetical protein